MYKSILQFLVVRSDSVFSGGVFVASLCFSQVTVGLLVVCGMFGGGDWDLVVDDDALDDWDGVDSVDWVDGVHNWGGNNGLGQDWGVVDDWGVVNGVHNWGVDGVHDRGSDDGLGQDWSVVDNWDGLDDWSVVHGNYWGVVGNGDMLDDWGVVHDVPGGESGKLDVRSNMNIRNFFQGTYEDEWLTATGAACTTGEATTTPGAGAATAAAIKHEKTNCNEDANGNQFPVS